MAKSPSKIAADTITRALERKEKRKASLVTIYAFRIGDIGNYSMPFIAPSDAHALSGVSAYAKDHPEISAAKVYKFAEFDYTCGKFHAFNPIEVKNETAG